MKKAKRITMAVLSLMMATAIESSTALAAEPQKAPDENSGYVAGIEDEMASLKRINPQLTEQQWEMAEKFENPEMNGLLLVDETQQLDEGHLVVCSCYTDAINPLASGRKTYYAFVQVFSDGTTDSELLISTYLWGDFEYNSETNYIHLVEGSEDGFSLKENSYEYPIILDEDSNGNKVRDIVVTYENKPSELSRCIVIYTTTASWDNYLIRYYKTSLVVDSNGNQIGSSLKIIKP